MIYFLGKEKAEQRFKQWSQSAAQHAAASVSAMQLCRAILMQSRANLRRTWSLLKTAKMWLNPQWAKWYQWAPLPSLGPLKIITTCPKLLLSKLLMSHAVFQQDCFSSHPRNPTEFTGNNRIQITAVIKSICFPAGCTAGWSSRHHSNPGKP